MKKCIHHLIAGKVHVPDYIRPARSGDCSICIPDDNNKNCSCYIPIDINMFYVVPEKMTKRQVLNLGYKEYCFLKEFIGYICDSDILIDEPIAFTAAYENNEYIYLLTVINRSADLTEDEFEIVKMHELGHTHVGESEEAADRWALEHLNGRQREILIGEWGHRHGKEYDE